jgi:hypothetical protein
MARQERGQRRDDGENNIAHKPAATAQNTRLHVRPKPHF